MPPQRIVSGQLVFRQAGPARPLANFAFTAVLPFGLLPDEHLSTGQTDADGRFVLNLSAREGKQCVRLKLTTMHRTYRSDGAPIDTPCEVRMADFDVGADTMDVGEVLVPWWPYRTDFPTPRTAKVEGRLPQAYSSGYATALALAVARTGPTEALLKGINAFVSSKPTMAEIQAQQPKTLTLRVEAEHPGRTRSDAWLADNLLNGFDIALQVGRDATDPQRMRVRIAWGDMPATNAFDLTDVDVTLEERGAEVLPTRIIVRVRQPGTEGAWKSDVTHTLTPADGARWEQAKRIVRCQYLLHGALDGHITRAHLQTEMFACAAFRNLRENPVRTVLLPHLQEIVAQDADGDNFAWGPHGIIAKQSALTMPVIHARMRRNTAGWDWKTFRPRLPLHPSHRYARAAWLYWEVLGEYLENFFLGHAHAIAEAWGEVRAMSDDLVAHALPYEPQPDDPLVIPADRNELDDPSVPRVTVGGAVRAVRPITHTGTPDLGEIDDLRQLCRYVLYQCTFNHSWTHDGQYDAGGELAYATFGLRNGSFGDERDAAIAPTPALNIDGISTNTLGTRANYGYIVADEEHDVPPALKAALTARRAAFAALGVDIDKIRSRINI